MQGPQEIGQAMMAVIAPGGIPLTDQSEVERNLRSMLGEFGIDPDATFIVGNGILQGAIQGGEDPESTVVSSFVVGVAVGAYLRGKT